MPTPVLLDKGEIGWDDFVGGTTVVTVTTASVSPGANQKLALLVSVIGGSATTWTTGTGSGTAVSSGSGPTWTKLDSTDAGSAYQATSAIFTAATTTDPGAFTVTFKFASGGGSEQNVYLYSLWSFDDADDTTPFGGKGIALSTGNGAQTLTMDAAPAAGDVVIAQSFADENTVAAYATFGTGTWTLKAAGNDLNGDGTTTDASTQKCAWNIGYRTGYSADADVAWSDVNSGTDNFSSTQVALVVKASAGSPQTWDGSVGTVSVTGVSGSWSTVGGPQTWNGSVGTISVSGVSGTWSVPQTWAGSTGTVSVTGVSGSWHNVSPTAWPVSVDSTNRKFLDQNGNPYFLKIMSSWGMAMRLSNADITTALEGLKAKGFNAVNVCGVGGVDILSDWDSVKWENVDGDSFWSGTPFQSSLGPGMASTDWLQSETERLGMVLVFSFFISNGTSGSGDEFDAASTAQMEAAGVAIATRYIDAPNIVWHLEGDGGEGGGSSTRGRKQDYLFKGLTETETTPRLIIAEPVLGGNSYDAFISQEGTDPTGFEWFHCSADSLYAYGSSSPSGNQSVVAFDTIWANTTTYPVWDCEPPYAKATDKYSGNFHQQLRERNYTVPLRGGCGINYGDEDFYGFDLSSYYDGGDTWEDVLTNTETTEASHAWHIVDAYCLDLTWAPDSSFVTTGVGSGDTKAAVGKSDTAAVAYFPSSRTVQVDTTVITPDGDGNVRLRWYNPQDGTYTTIASAEAPSATRSVTYPSAHADTTNDWVLIVDQPGAASTIFLGSTQITSVYLGSTPITKIYYGSTQIWP